MIIFVNILKMKIDSAYDMKKRYFIYIHNLIIILNQ